MKKYLIYKQLWIPLTIVVFFLSQAAYADQTVWGIRFYVDEFGDKTNQRYITNLDPIIGTFSNTATEGSDLKVRFLIGSPESITIQLYEYAGNNPVKSSNRKMYGVNLKDAKGNTTFLVTFIESDRLRFSFRRDSVKLNDILSNGGIVKFAIYEDGRISQYNFSINADGYKTEMKKLMDLKK